MLQYEQQLTLSDKTIRLQQTSEWHSSATAISCHAIITRLTVLASTHAQNLTILSSAIPEKFKGV